jgi:hypothetical protein
VASPEPPPTGWLAGPKTGVAIYIFLISLKKNLYLQHRDQIKNPRKNIKNAKNIKLLDTLMPQIFSEAGCKHRLFSSGFISSSSSKYSMVVNRVWA